MKTQVLASALLVMLAGCSNAPPSSSGSADGPTYHRDVKPLVDVKCGGCHVPGGIAPFPLTSYAEVSAQAPAVSSAVAARIMPPWPPDDTCSTYVHDRSLSQDQIDTLTKWVADGSPEGDPNATAVTVADTRATLSRVDLTLTMPTAYTPQLSPDEYRCFLIDWPNPATSYVTGMGVKPGTPAIVHHVIAFLATPAQVPSYQALDATDGRPGWTCFGGPGGSGVGSAEWIGGWAPGAMGSDFPPDTGIEIPPGSKVVMQVHYNTLTTMPEPDQTSILIKTDPTVAKKAAVIPFADPAWVTKKMMDIPAHTMDATHNYAMDLTPYLSYIANGALTPNQPFTLYSAALHMHTRGTHAVTRLNRSGGAQECLLEIGNWNFHWQGSYGFTQPKTVNPGDQFYLECHWNNMGATDLNWGEGTEDEMCLGVYYATD
jgi:hypothetical protein